MKMFKTNKLMPTKRLLIYTIESYYSSAKNIFFSFFMPLIMFFILYIFLKSLFQDNFRSNNTTSWGLMTFTPLCSMVAVSSLIVNWRSTNIISKLKIIKIDKIQIMLSIWVIFIINTYSCFIINICSGLIIDLFFTNKNFTIAIKLINHFYQWIGILFILLLSTTIIFFFTYIISFSINSPIIAQTVVVISMLWFIFASDIGLNRNNLFSSTLYGNLGNVATYFNPLAGLNWFMDGVASNILIDHSNVAMVIQDLYVFMPFDVRRNFSDYYSVIYGLLYSLMWLIIFAFISFKFIKIRKI